jgi:molybdopterin synthase catalytic subunit
MSNPNTFISLSYLPLSETEARHLLHDEACGAHVLFLGTVRSSSKGKEVLHLEFEAYELMVRSVLEGIAEDLRSQFGIHGVLLFHRLGRVEVGQAAVIAGISSAHRKQAFEACAVLMDRLKQTVPIWKKEYTIDGAVWVSANP